MSIYICGMEMPKVPGKMEQGMKIPYIDVRIFADGDAVVSAVESPYYKKYEALQIPPHGRLIDADELHYSRIRIAHEDGTIGGYNAVVMSAEINDALTVIPADQE